MFKEDHSKTDRQLISIDKWKYNGGIGIVNACPRFGKSRIGQIIYEKVIKSKPDRTVLILSPSEVTANNWKNYIEESIRKDNSIDFIIHNHTISWYLENKDKIGDTFTLVIIDEIHKFTSDKRYELISNLKYQFFLGLTGTMPDRENKDKLLKLAPIIDVITEEEAITKGWISPYIEYNIALELSDEDKARYAKFSPYIRETLNTFKNVAVSINKYLNTRGIPNIFKDDFDLIYSCHNGKKFPKGFLEPSKIRDIVADIQGWSRDLDLTTDFGKQRDIYWNPNSIYERCKKFKQFVASRNEILIDNDVKLEKVVELVNILNKPTICFNESIDFVNRIADRIGKDAIAYHSRIVSRPLFSKEINDFLRYASGAKAGEIKKFGKDTLKREALEGIIDGRYKVLVTAKALDEGVTIPNIEAVITTAGSTNPIQYEQRNARGKSIDSENKCKILRVFNLYFDDFYLSDGTLIKSRDKAKLIERQQNNKSYINWITNINDISI